MKVRDAVSGSWAKPWTAACAAAKVEMVFIVRSFVKSEMEMERGSFGGLAVAAATVLCIKLARGVLNNVYFKSDKRDVELGSCFLLHTIVDNHAGDTECFLGFCKSGGDGGGVGKVAGDVQLVGCASGFSRGDCYAVTFCCEGASYALADVGACTEDEDDGRCARHGGVVW